RKPFTLEEFKSIYSKVPRLTVDLIVRMNGGIVLSLRTLKSWNNQWHLPGGTILLHETVEQAVHGVALEELGIKVNVIKCLGYVEYPSEKEERGYGQAIALAMLCDVGSGKLTVNEEASKVELFTVLPENIIRDQAIFLERHWHEIIG
ncbi:MAG: NUDIX domain-containing protein, partial [Patescibacteria group bacterium]